MSIRLYAWDVALKEMGGAWAALVESRGLNPSLHPAWMKAIVESHALGDSAQVVVVESREGDTAIVPFIARTILLGGVPVRFLDLCSNNLSYHAELVVSGRMDRVLAELLSSKALPRWDVFRFGNLPLDGATRAAVQDVAGEQGFRSLRYPGEVSPYVSITTNWNDYLPTLSKKMRANITRCARTTNQAGEASMEWYGRGCNTEKLLADILEVEARSWKADEGKSIQSSDREIAYYQRLLPWLADNGLCANVLYVGGRPAAYALCAEWQGWVGQLKTSYAQDVRDSGFRVIQASIEHAFSCGRREYDFLGDTAPHKLRWADQTRPHETIWVFAKHWRGSASYLLKRAIDVMRRGKRARPWVQKAA